VNASEPSSGTHTAVRSPEQRLRASFNASRRSVFTRSPGFVGTSEGATTAQSTPPGPAASREQIPLDTGFIAGTQILNRAKLTDELTDRLFAVSYRIQATNFAIWLGYSDDNRLGMDYPCPKIVTSVS
jgi:hypothetical protein